MFLSLLELSFSIYREPNWFFHIGMQPFLVCKSLEHTQYMYEKYIIRLIPSLLGIHFNQPYYFNTI